jgi:hypothetical protein
VQILLTIGVLTIAGILFYRQVERPHKIIVGKIALAVTVVISLGILLFLDSGRRERLERDRVQLEEEAERQVVTVRFIRDSISGTTQRDPVCGLITHGEGCTMDTVRVLDFELCNKGKRTVTAVAFSPKTTLRGRSTKYDVVPARKQNGSIVPIISPLQSDYILPAGRCSVLTWEGSYTVKDSIFATVVRVDTQ